jgi:hypothetical protein
LRFVVCVLIRNQGSGREGNEDKDKNHNDNQQHKIIHFLGMRVSRAFGFQLTDRYTILDEDYHGIEYVLYIVAVAVAVAVDDVPKYLCA